ncbi:MAG: BlaI/MecI/CopY family transcriptional regulator [Lachnospiraceae bacterium]|nr:BlaI/MecI/CopY family transcriptional regulator [Lachnospiraceae bacterium]
MDENRLGLMEGRFADIIWESAPISTGDLVKICEAQFGWKRTTTYTMLKRLCQRGIFENDGGTVIVLMPKEKFHQKQSEQFVTETFGGSLPAFIATFTKGKTLSDEEADEIQCLIDKSRIKRDKKSEEVSK